MEQKLAELTQEKTEILGAIHSLAKAFQLNSLNMDSFFADYMAKSARMKSISLNSGSNKS